MFLKKFCVPSSVHVAPGTHVFPAFAQAVAVSRGALMIPRFNRAKLDISSRVNVCSQPFEAESVHCGSTGGVYDRVNS